ncbi:DUF998 domain-containing protein [Dactylosporangium sp. AC04546]|uniref:DUF998 domain-containing protein n=1 Tax=Dactylosporangium sp. AC04546 TaxID=2862460 RepID=UPI001EDE0883|nr:DUF998 domain-containing protein [Dactylosporangium sp. AC04546]WVK83279.1 DUF998 domain-containing protein [Dactylosporangium sp. AC04546]
MDAYRRWLAGGSALLAAAGAAGLAIAVAGSEPFRYVSESGVAGAPNAGLYRVGMILLAVSIALLSVPAWRTGRATGLPLVGQWGFLGGLALAVAAPLAGVAGAVTCSPGCPLPPYETPTARDLVHAGGAIGALLLIALVILVYALQPDPGPLRHAGRLAVALAYPPLILSAIGIVFAGRGLFTGLMERAALVAVSAWLVATAALHLRRKP